MPIDHLKRLRYRFVGTIEEIRRTEHFALQLGVTIDLIVNIAILSGVKTNYG